jgi:hypothetical protein
VFAKISASVASASDRVYGTSTIAKITDVADEEHRIGLIRVLPHLLTVMMERDGHADRCTRRCFGEERVERAWLIAPKPPPTVSNHSVEEVPFVPKVVSLVADTSGEGIEMANVSGGPPAESPPSGLLGRCDALDDLDGVLPSLNLDHTTVDTETVKVTIIDDGVPVERTAYQIGPAVGKPTHYSESVNSMSAAADKRIVGRQRAYKPKKNYADKLETFVQAMLDNVLTDDAIRAWKDRAENAPLRDIASSKWSQETFDRAYQNLLDQGAECRVGFSAQVKSEVLQFNEKKGHRPRIIANCGPEGQLCAKVVVKCLEDLVFKHFKSRSIKHQPKMEAVNRLLGEIEEHHRVLEGDGAAWDACVSHQLKCALENKLLWHVAERLFIGGDAVECLEAWWKADAKQRERPRTSLKYSKGRAAAYLTMANTRMSGDAGTSVLNWIVNAAIWACVLLDDPGEWVRNPERGVYKSYGKDIVFRVAYEGDDSLIITTSDMSVEAIVAIWESFGFNMEIFDRKPATANKYGDIISFVGVECVRQPKDDKGRCVSAAIPQFIRGVVQSAWTLAEPSPELCASIFAAKAAMSKDCSLLHSYYASICAGWLEKCKTPHSVELDRESQFQLFGNYEAGRVANLREECFRESTKDGDAVLSKYLTQEQLFDAYRRMDSFGGGLDLTVSPKEIFPASLF